MSSPAQEIVFITGANVGVGREIAKKLLQEHGERFYVFIGSIPIDVTDNDSITRAAKSVSENKGRLDILYVNAGIAPDKSLLPAGEPLSNIINVTMATNVAGAAQTAETFVPLLQQAENPRIIFISSGMGSLTRVSTIQDNTPWPAYSASKAALNMIMLWFWRRFPGWKLNACCPGWRATSLNDFGLGGPPGTAPGKLEDGARNAVRLALSGREGESGRFSHWVDGEEREVTFPW